MRFVRRETRLFGQTSSTTGARIHRKYPNVLQIHVSINERIADLQTLPDEDVKNVREKRR